jgi:hypothetical protein
VSRLIAAFLGQARPLLVGSEPRPARKHDAFAMQIVPASAGAPLVKFDNDASVHPNYC